MKKVLSIWSVLTVFGLVYLIAWIQPEPVPEWKNLEIVETIPTTPNIVKLAENEVRFTAHWDEDTSDNTVEINYQDAQLLMMVASAEALSEGTDGMIKIMETVLNRVKSPLWPNTIQEVVYQRGAFQTVTNGNIYKAEITPEVHMALVEVEKNQNAEKRVIGFETTENGRTLEQCFDYLYTIGNHDFYTCKKD